MGRFILEVFWALRVRGGSYRKLLVLAATAALGGGCNQAPSQANPVAAQPPVASPTWPTDLRSVYELSMSSKLSMSGNDMVSFQVHGELALDSAQPDLERVQLLAAFSGLAFKAADPEAQPQFDALSRELEKPFGLTLARGELTEVQLRPDATAFASSIVRTVAAALQFGPRPAGSVAPTWDFRENDATGAYTAEYRALETAGQFGKRKLRYETMKIGQVSLGSVAPQVTPEVVASKGLVKLGRVDGKPAGAWVLDSADYDEQLKSLLAPTSPVVSTTHLTLTIKARNHRPPAPDFAAALAGTRAAAPGSQARGSVPSANFDAARIGDYTIEKALRELQEQARDPQRKQLFDKVRGETHDPEGLARREATFADHGRVFTALAALLRRDPRDISKVLEVARRGSPGTQALLDALASAASPQAQAALVQLMNDPTASAELRRSAANSLIRTPRATPDTVSALVAHTSADDALRVHALYGLGTMARQLREAGDSSRSEAIVSTLMNELALSKTANRQVDALRGIANSGAASAFDVVRPYFNSTSRKVKAAALDALRLMQHPDVDGLIAEQALNGSKDLQGAALDAISVREPNDALTTALQKVMLSRSAAAIRIRAIRVAQRWLSQRADLRTTLEELIKSEQPEQIQQEARRALGS